MTCHECGKPAEYMCGGDQYLVPSYYYYCPEHANIERGCCEVIHRDLRREALDADGVEVQPVRFFRLNGERFAEVTYSSKPNVWGVYWRLKTGLALHVSDHRLKANAEKKAKKLRKMLFAVRT